MREAVFGRNTPRFLVADTSIMNYGVEGSQRIDLEDLDKRLLRYYGPA